MMLAWMYVCLYIAVSSPEYLCENIAQANAAGFREDIVSLTSIIKEYTRSLEPPGLQCRNLFETCVDSYFAYFNSFHENYTRGALIRVAEDRVDQMFNLTLSFQDCLDQILLTCENDYHWGQQRARYYTRLFQYVCSSDGKQEFVNTNGSQCHKEVKTNRLRSMCERRVQVRYNLELRRNYGRLPEDRICSYFGDYRQCVIDAIGGKCGDEVASFVSSLDDSANQESYDIERGRHGC